MKRFIIDIEASGLGPESYPIEIAIVDLGSDLAFGSLLRPDESWRDGEWDEMAEEVHGITQGMLQAHGRDPALFAKELWHAIADAEVFSDAPDMDSFWLDRLRQTAWPELQYVAVKQLPIMIGDEVNRQHRALADALLLRNAFRARDVNSA